jgi:hypothetical protein
VAASFGRRGVAQIVERESGAVHGISRDNGGISPAIVSLDCDFTLAKCHENILHEQGEERANLKKSTTLNRELIGSRLRCLEIN